MDQVDKIMTYDDFCESIIAYESGELPEEDIIELFQELINSGLAWKLQGSYGRTAKQLIEGGYCNDIQS